MTPQEFFEALAGRITPAIEREFPGYGFNGCILATRVCIEVGRYFGVPVEPLACQVVLYNAAYAKHLEAGDEPDIARWHEEDGSHSVGIGFGPVRDDRWNGHLIAVAGGVFADYAIRQAERLSQGIVTGPALIGPYRGAGFWQAVNEQGTTIEYRVTGDTSYRAAPDWKDPGRRKRICGPLIRELTKACVTMIG